ncbi:MAG TPA: DEAD/DEAH box helicase [Vicinamibacterales bacterium]
MAAIALRPGDIVRIRDERWSVSRYVEGSSGAWLDVRGHDRNNRGEHACFLLPHEPWERLPQSAAPRIVRPRTWCRRLRAALADATPSPDTLRTRPRSTLAVLPFQLEPVLAITRGLASRVLIADEVGLGKTVQAGLVINETLLRTPDAHVLIVTPAGLRGQWRDELHERLVLDASILDSSALARHSWALRNPWSAHPLIITSLDFVKRAEVLRSLEALVWDLVVFDEAHALAGRSDRATAALALAERARTVVLLTATPHSGDDQAFERLCGTGDLGRTFPLLVFRRTRRDIGMSSSRRVVSLRVRPSIAEAEMHRALTIYVRLIWTQKGVSSAGARLAAGVLSRRACSSPASLARSIERRLALLARTDDDPFQTRLPFDDSADDDEPAGALATPGLHNERDERVWLQRLLELARRASHDESKLNAIARCLRRARQPAIVFTEYRDTLATLASALATSSPLLLHGGLSTAERDEVARQFSRGEAPLLLATDAASEGLNLHQRCRLVINLELPWTPVRLEQRIGRVDRIGQTRRVHAIHLLAAGSSEEESVARLLLRTARVADALHDLRPMTDSEIADVVIGGRRAAPGRGEAQLRSPIAVPINVITANLGPDAEAEAARLELARALAPGVEGAPDSRPCVTVLRRRHDVGISGQVAGSYFVYRQLFLDLDLHVVWDTLTALAATLHVESRRAPEVRAWVARSIESLGPILEREGDRARTTIAEALRPHRELATRREHAIADALTARRARLSAALVQPGLFDRRHERAAASQNAVIEEALSRCAARLGELDRRGQVIADAAALAFAVLLR